MPYKKKNEKTMKKYFVWLNMLLFKEHNFWKK